MGGGEEVGEPDHAEGDDADGLVHGEGGEAHIPATVRDVTEPTREEREQRRLTHLPFRSSCKWCVQKKTKNQPHRNLGPRAPPNIPVFHAYYFSLGREEELGAQVTLGIRDEGIGMKLALLLPHKRC